MATNLTIDDNLLSEAQKAGGHKTPKDTVTEALREYIVVQKSFFLPQRRRDAEGIISLRLCASAGDHSYYAPAEETYLDSYMSEIKNLN